MAPETLEFLANVGASAATGGVVIALTNPLDCLKQRVQVRAAGPALLAHSSRIVATEGLWRGLWLPGLATNIAACTCSVGTRLGLYARVRRAVRGVGVQCHASCLVCEGVCHSSELCRSSASYLLELALCRLRQLD